MKILLTTGIFVPEIGGPATYALKISKELTNLGHQVRVIAYSKEKKYNFDNTLPYSVIRIKKGNKLLNYYRYLREILKNISDFDLIYSFDYFSAGIPSLLATKIYGKKLIIRMGGDLIWERYLEKRDEGVTLADFYKNKFYKVNWLKFLIAKIVLKYADLLIFTTEFQAKLFIDHYKISDKKIRYIGNPMPGRIVKEFSKETGKTNRDIIWAGRMVAKNNLIRLVRVFCSLKLKQKNYQLILIGEGPLKTILQEIIKNKNCAEVIIKDTLPNSVLVKRIANSYAVVFPSYTDISPNLVLECLSVGIPFILTKEHGFDWLRHSVIEFDPKDDKDLESAIIKILDKSFYAEYKNSLSKINYIYSFKQVAEDTIKLFKEIL